MFVVVVIIVVELVIIIQVFSSKCVSSMVLEVCMGFQDVVFLSSQAGFYNTFLENCILWCIFGPLVCHTGPTFKQGHALCKNICFAMSSLLWQSHFMWCQ